ncbi:hypothetical protein FE251_08445 [Georgenia wutianyii]|uniref:Minor tail protein n=1 Tax=Georgenia wutianyii TaxID=2585135 RepID=A0ABX5VLN4_9MICO|nr:hypothetical protein [Georgenia wutianyii]QDB79396.1 hypothetical protein FE251_08445 [Georgenia wutianyii]
MVLPTGPRRASYFAGQSLTARTLNDNLATEWARRWAHNRFLHGAGIGQGLTVTATVGQVEVTVEPGYGIDPEGHEIVLVAPVTVQVPPVPGPTDYVLVCRFDPDPTGFTDTGLCGADGVSAWMDEPLVEFVPATDFPGAAGSALPLATVRVTGCVLSSISFGRRQVLGERRLPYVDAGVHRPSPAGWELATTDAGVAYGLRTVADTSVAGFRGTPDYQARLSGRRWFDVTGPELSTPVMLWTTEPDVVGAGATRLTVEILVPTVRAGRTDGTFAEFLDGSGLTDEITTLVATELEWAITWIGVEGSL